MQDGGTSSTSHPTQPGAADSSQQPPAQAARARGRVLVVDDEPLVARSVARLLAAEHEVTTLTSSLEALRRAEAGERWDLVLCDLSMPELSGMELARRLAVVAPELSARLLFLTGGAVTEEAQAFLEAGRPCLEKPIDPATLRARVRQAVAAAQAATAG